MLNLLEKHKDIIKSFRVECYDQEGETVRAKLEIVFTNDSRLFLKEYLFTNGERKYAFHWTDHSGNLLCRWDNAPHWMDVETFPHHKHVEGKVLAARETTLEEVLVFIAGELIP